MMDRVKSSSLDRFAKPHDPDLEKYQNSPKVKVKSKSKNCQLPKVKVKSKVKIW